MFFHQELGHSAIQISPVAVIVSLSFWIFDATILNVFRSIPVTRARTFDRLNFTIQLGTLIGVPSFRWKYDVRSPYDRIV